jgi:hypothetical protein
MAFESGGQRCPVRSCRCSHASAKTVADAGGARVLVARYGELVGGGGVVVVQRRGRGGANRYSQLVSVCVALYRCCESVCFLSLSIFPASSSILGYLMMGPVTVLKDVADIC